MRRMTICKKISDLRDLEIDLLSVTEVKLSEKDLSSISRELSWLSGCKNLKKLKLFSNRIERIESLEALASLTTLSLSSNKIEKIEGLSTLTSLTNLCLSCNQIKKIEGISTLTSLTHLHLFNNQIDKIEGLSTLTSLTYLHLYGNRIEKIEGLETLTSLTELNLSHNQIEKIEGLSTLTSLTTLYLSVNRIKKIEGLETLTSLTELNLSCNQIEKIEGLSTLASLTTLHLYGNRITHVPNILVYCPRLTNLYTTGNPVEVYHPVIEDFFKNERRIKNKLAVYTDRESVHSASVQSSIRRNIVTLLETDRLTPFRRAEEVTVSILADTELSEATKKAIVEYCSDAVNEVTALPGVKFADVLLPVWNRVVNSSDRETATEIKRVLSVEMAESECVCFTGRISRLVNCLTGFFPDIIVEISKSEQISNIILLVREKLTVSSSGYSREAHVQLVKSEMTERGYTPEEIEVWIAAIE